MFKKSTANKGTFNKSIGSSNNFGTKSTASNQQIRPFNSNPQPSQAAGSKLEKR